MTSPTAGTGAPIPAPVRRRGVLSGSGFLLFVCLFLPTLRVCDSPTAPIQFPPSYVIYLGGVIVGLLGVARLHAARRACFVTLLGAWLTTALVLCSLGLGAESPPVGIVLGLASVVAIVAILRKVLRVPWTARAFAAACLAHGLLAAGWSALFVFDPEGMWGAGVSLAASLALTLAAGRWFADEQRQWAAARAAREPAPLPAARLL